VKGKLLVFDQAHRKTITVGGEVGFARWGRKLFGMGSNPSCWPKAESGGKKVASQVYPGVLCGKCFVFGSGSVVLQGPSSHHRICNMKSVGLTCGVM